MLDKLIIIRVTGLIASLPVLWISWIAAFNYLRSYLLGCVYYKIHLGCHAPREVDLGRWKLNGFP